MKIQIDTATKTVLVLEACTLDELTAFLCRVDPERAGEYRISSSETAPIIRGSGLTDLQGGFGSFTHVDPNLFYVNFTRIGGTNMTDTGIRYTVDGLPRTDGYHETINKVN